MERFDRSEILKKYGAYTHLKMLVPEHLREVYAEYIEKHNNTLLESLTNPRVFLNDGFDLFVPEKTPCDRLTKINFGVKIEATRIRETSEFPCPCGVELFVRSSIYKWPIRLANSVGIIDAGYRGDIIGMFDLLPQYEPNEIFIGKHTRIAQLWSGAPFLVEMVDELSDSDRGENGFGSSGA